MGERRIGEGGFADAFVAPRAGTNARLDRIAELFDRTRFDALRRAVDVGALAVGSARLSGVGDDQGVVAPAAVARLRRRRSVSDLSWPQAAAMSRPRGVRTGLA